MRKTRQLSVSVGDLGIDNQFMQGKMRGASSRPNIAKDPRIQKLEERNNKLQEEVIKVERALSGIDDKTTYGIRLPQIKSDVIRKELQNAYKKIKQYEYEINKRRNSDLQGAYVEQLRKQEKVLLQKQKLSEKLRKEILQIKKLSLEYTKMLKDDTLKKEYAEKERKINADIRWLNEMLKKQEQRKSQFNMNLQKQQQLIKKIEKDLSGQQYPKQFFQNLRARFINPKVPTIEAEEDQDIVIPSQGNIDNERSPQHYESITGEIRLYRKLDNDYEQKITILSRQKEQSEQRNLASRNRLLEVQYEIEKVQARVLQLKAQLDPKALIPVHIEALREEARRFNHIKKDKTKITMAHLYRFSQIGQGTKAGKRFIDRPVIGKKAAKIIGISFYESKQDKKLLGLKATYLIGKTTKEGSLNLLCNVSLVQERHFTLEEGNYVKTIDCFQDENGLIVGISMVSNSNQILKAGLQTDHRKNIEINPAQIPVCLYGCILQNGIEMLGTEAVSE